MTTNVTRKLEVKPREKGRKCSLVHSVFSSFKQNRCVPNNDCFVVPMQFIYRFAAIAIALTLLLSQPAINFYGTALRTDHGCLQAHPLLPDNLDVVK